MTRDELLKTLIDRVNLLIRYQNGVIDTYNGNISNGFYYYVNADGTRANMEPMTKIELIDTEIEND